MWLAPECTSWQMTAEAGFQESHWWPPPPDPRGVHGARGARGVHGGGHDRLLP